MFDKTYIESITCKLCNSSLRDPVEVLPCKSLLCCSCVLKVKALESFNCPGCSESHELIASSFSRMSPVTEKMIKNILIKCNKCNQIIKLSQSQESCDQHGSVCLNLKEVTCRPLEAEPTSLEKQAATNIVSRMLHYSDNALVKLPTGGTVSEK